MASSVRISGVNLPIEKKVYVSLSYLFGIGRVLGKKICKDLGIDCERRMKDLSDEELHRAVYEHTVSVLNLLRENGIEPEWVQVGNEINNGITWPRAGLKDNPQLLISLLNTGYDAVKEIFPTEV